MSPLPNISQLTPSLERPIPGYHFRVDFGLEKFLIKDVGFKSVSGISFEALADEKEVGGVIGDKVSILKGVKYSDLVLERGMFKGSMLIDWMTYQLQAKRKLLIPIVVTAMNAKGSPVYSWFFINAYPTKWETSGFNSEKSELLVEKITFRYLYYKQVDMTGRSVEKELQAMEKLNK